MTAAAAGTAYVGLAAWRAEGAGRVEQRLFAALNRRGGKVSALRVPQQLGTPWVLPALALGAAARRGRRLAIAAAVALPLEKAGEVAVKKAFERPRPAASAPVTYLRDDAPVEGPAYPSGHVAIATCALGLLAPYLGRGTVAALTLPVAANAYGRVHQGAHYPVDAVGGALLGASLAAGLSYATGRPA